MRELIQEELENFIKKRKKLKDEMKNTTGNDLLECRQRIIMVDEIIKIKRERLQDEIN